jgi:hypothetical protein
MKINRIWEEFMEDKDKHSNQEHTSDKDLPFEIRKGAEYHKPPRRDDAPPPPSPPAKEKSDKDK